MRTLITACALFASASVASAQMTPQRWLEIRPTGGAIVPTGTQRDVMKDGAMFGLQLAYQLQPAIHLVGSFGWTAADHKHIISSQILEKGTNLYQYDIGVEFNLIRAINQQWDLKPFLGIGAGARTYQYDEASLGRRTCQAAYGSLGTEFQTGRTALRMEARDYLYCYKDPVQNRQFTRNDVALSLGVAFHVAGH